MNYDVGDVARIRATMIDADTGEAVDPDVVTAVAYAPDGSGTALEPPVRTGFGEYVVEATLTRGGWWTIVYSTVNPQATEQRRVYANPVPLT
jgi:hypothetical protein